MALRTVIHTTHLMCAPEIEREDVKSHLVDMRYVMNLFGSGLVYHAAPLAKEMEISGYVKFVA